MTTRIEKDTMGEMAVQGDRLYGAQTARAVLNFKISGRTIGSDMISALGLIKKCAAAVNRDLGLLPPEFADAIIDAASKVANGEMDDHFPVDVFQTGSGTSSNMNANEVIANLAIVSLGGKVGSKTPIHPNDHVNLGQSSNDVFPTAIHVAALRAIEHHLIPTLAKLEITLEAKSEAFSKIVKTGRTHLQDAVLMTLGQEFSGFKAQVSAGIRHLKITCENLRALPIGGTAVGTGLNTHPEFGSRMAAALSNAIQVSFYEAGNHFEAQGARDGALRTSAALKSLALSLMKIANDIRWLGSGPRLGLGELIIPAVQPGSSIMPGKVNPVIAESLMQVCAQVVGNDAAITASQTLDNLQLHAAQPLIAANLLEIISLLDAGVSTFESKLVSGLEADCDHIAAGLEQSLAMATALVPLIGYDAAAQIAKQAESEKKTVRQVALEKKILPKKTLDEALNPAKLVGVKS